MKIRGSEEKGIERNKGKGIEGNEGWGSREVRENKGVSGGVRENK